MHYYTLNNDIYFGPDFSQHFGKTRTPLCLVYIVSHSGPGIKDPLLFRSVKSEPGQFDSHEDLVMSKMNNLGTGVGFNCLECDYMSPMKSNMRYHVESKHLDLNYPCNICNKTQKSYKTWYLHVQRHKKSF